MRAPASSVKALIILLMLTACGASSQEKEEIKTYSNEFVVRIPGKTPDEVKELADQHGYTYLAPLMFDDLHHVRHKRLARRSMRPHPKNSSEPWHEKFPQEVKIRTKRDYGPTQMSRSLRLQAEFERNLKRDTRTRHGNVGGRMRLSDPKWPLQWYLNRGGGLDMNVERAWSEFNVSGKGVVITILDDGLEKDHPDIASNYDSKASFDMNDHDSDPQPHYEEFNMNRHGTRCAGEVAGLRDNNVCGVGVAYQASIGGIRMLDGDVTDVVEARSLALNPGHIHVYSASWGPDDDARTVDGPGPLANRALEDGILNGRHGLGSIFVWASGNGGKLSDNCNCDGYVNSIYTLAVSAATESGNIPWYSESCAATLATTYSSGTPDEGQIVTSDLHHNCTDSHTGTSASAPLAAGIVALALEANPLLTWRDMQHVVVRATRLANLFAPDWVTNGAGRNVSHWFGFGLLDAHKMVELSKKWKHSLLQKVCSLSYPGGTREVSAKNSLILQLPVQCRDVKYIEHTVAEITLQSKKPRGDFHIYLTSAAGTKSTLLTTRPSDDSEKGFTQWPFMTVHNWGENPNGNWTLEIHNDRTNKDYEITFEWTLTLFGTTENPDLQFDRDASKRTASEGRTSSNNIGVLVPPAEVRSTNVRDHKCSEGSYSHKTPMGEILCTKCHYTCKTCIGPNDYQCSGCYEDSLLHSGGYCYNKNLLEQMAVHWHWLNALLTVFTISCVLCITLACIVMYLACQQRRRFHAYEDCT